MNGGPRFALLLGKVVELVMVMLAVSFLINPAAILAQELAFRDFLRASPMPRVRSRSLT